MRDRSRRTVSCALRASARGDRAGPIEAVAERSRGATRGSSSPRVSGPSSPPRAAPCAPPSRRGGARGSLASRAGAAPARSRGGRGPFGRGTARRVATGAGPSSRRAAGARRAAAFWPGASVQWKSRFTTSVAYAPGGSVNATFTRRRPRFSSSRLASPTARRPGNTRIGRSSGSKWISGVPGTARSESVWPSRRSTDSAAFSIAGSENCVAGARSGKVCSCEQPRLRRVELAREQERARLVADGHEARHADDVLQVLLHALVPEPALVREHLERAPARLGAEHRAAVIARVLAQPADDGLVPLRAGVGVPAIPLAPVLLPERLHPRVVGVVELARAREHVPERDLEVAAHQVLHDEALTVLQRPEALRVEVVHDAEPADLRDRGRAAGRRPPRRGRGPSPRTGWRWCSPPRAAPPPGRAASGADPGPGARSAAGGSRGAASCAPACP